MSTSNKRIESIQGIPPPKEYLDLLPCTQEVETLVSKTRENVSAILHGKDPRILVVIGPCSIHDPEAAMDYAQRLLPLRRALSEKLEIVMRVYFEKPRTTIGWKGLINDPHLNQSYDVEYGLKLARKLLLDLNKIGMPAGTEFLDAVTGQYYADLISWGAIGARTTESQIHREIASGLSCPVGFKNGTNGNVDIAIDAVIAANTRHIFLSPTESGTTALFQTRGNQDAHIILRGGVKPNYDSESVNKAASELRQRNVNTGVVVDFSHANSQKQFSRQLEVGQSIADQIKSGQSRLRGCMIESHIYEGNQAISKKEELDYGRSITDACLGFEDSERLLELLAQAV